MWLTFYEDILCIKLNAAYSRGKMTYRWHYLDSTALVCVTIQLVNIHWFTITTQFLHKIKALEIVLQ